MKIHNLLKRYKSEFRGCINQYQKSHLMDSVDIEFEPERDDARIDFKGTQWQCSYREDMVPNREDAIEISMCFNVVKGPANEGGVGARFIFNKWSRDNYVIMPGAVYSGNRFESRPLSYPPLLCDPIDIGPDIQTIITDIPRLNIHNGLSRIQQLTGDLVTPAIGFYSPSTELGFWLLTDQQTSLGESGIEINENETRTQAAISLVAPGVREDFRYTMCNMRHPSEDRGAKFKEGQKVKLRFRVYLFECRSIQGLFDRFIEIRKDLSGPTHLYHQLPFSSAWAIQENKYNSENWDNNHEFYNSGIGPQICNKWQVGWVGGGMVTHPLLFEGTLQSRERALKNINFLLARGQARSGFFYGVGDGEKWYSDGHSKPHADKWHLIRKSSDALYFLIKQFMLLEKQDSTWKMPILWRQGMLRLADAFVRLWEKHGQFGQFVDIETGDIIVGGSTSAGIAPAGLALASKYFKSDNYLHVAIASAEHYYKRDVLAGVTTGAPGEMLQCPDSESAFGLLESFVVLYEETGDRRWIDMAIDMANQCSSWCVSYDYHFPPNSLFGRLGIHTTGAVLANAQNKHGAPGICTLSGDSLFKLYRATGNKFYLDMIQETAHNLPQYLSRADRLICAPMKPGWMTERVNMSDWLEGVGEVIEGGSCWCEVSNMLTWVEVPGLYIQPDTAFVCAIDNVNARVIADNNNKLTIEITNPTNFEALVKMLVENSTEMSKPLGQNALWGCQKIQVAPNSSVIMEINRS